ncbi:MULTISPECIES: preprotein translocase subunit SecY [Dermacoccus]|uniref:Protein translocase subunit SecY n=1 Tax=Dermacoccus nishinomiyaensis TaxID=1274 RepID=A0A075JD81_9MICO|nr:MULTISPECIES: preprotein translocase subunit SecY [Dermacoccus]AIF40236.1 preprotein translocase subunit SecY [Dermacoccus nishinomiyaensis]EFP57536.1 preprotein translocase, SecY subunit [Dermacoccus sp. Ellin185]MCG7430018.1 preprotein translocase subunit SecY [Dermacoccus nishinomiyaensis]MCT1603442.1 preprotein translocase subunit SecY [Dermacoccus nishinomiyaensis]TCJ90994.1 protein translocase subunit secY/sec61 alpha [Dermacoccus sp. SAI-028]
MLTSFGRAFRTPELRNKILFTLAIMALFRLGSHIPTPGISFDLVAKCQAAAGGSNSLLGLANLFSGGALLQLSIFALGIMPYITASIIIQLLTVVIPRFETLKKEGQSGQAKMTQYTRYLAIALALLQSSTLITAARSPWTILGGSPTTCSTIMTDDSIPTVLLMILTLTAGTGLIMWLGEQVTERGIGNGMSLLILTAVAARVPQSLWAIHNQGWGRFIAVVIMCLAVTTAVVFVENSQRRIPVQYAKRMVGRRSYGGTTTYIPLKVNMANVIPIIFATSLLSLPVMVSQFAANKTNPPGWAQWINTYLARGDHPVYMAIYTVLILFFTFFYVSITYQPDEVADNLKQAGSFIPGVRAGSATAKYLNYVLTRITTVGAIYIAFLALLPLIALALFDANQNVPFGGASILILVGVGLETVKQVDSKLQQHNYEGFLR